MGTSLAADIDDVGSFAKPAERAARRPSGRRDLTAVIEESQILLNYAAQAGIIVPPATIKALVDAHAALEAGPVAPETAIAFYAAATALAASVAPVTVETLSVSDIRTARGLRWNGVFAIGLAVIVLIFSGISFVTTSMTKDIETGIVHANDLAVKLRDRVGPPNPANSSETMCGPPTNPPDPALPAGDQLVLITELQDFAATIRTTLGNATKLNFFIAQYETSPLATYWKEWQGDIRYRFELQPALINMRKEALCKIDTYQYVREFAQVVRADSVAFYGAISAYILPVLYALLGAFAFNLRDFSERVRRHSYHPSSYANTARTIAAMTVGTIISLFNIFNKETSLQPFAVAFLAGYGVEVFFAFLDALLVTFNGRGRADPVARSGAS